MEQDPKKLDRAHKIALGIISAVCCCIIGISAFALVAPDAVNDLTDQQSEIAKNREAESESAENETSSSDNQTGTNAEASQNENIASNNSATTNSKTRENSGKTSTDKSGSSKKATSGTSNNSNNSSSSSSSNNNDSDTVTVSVKVWGSAKGITVSKSTSATLKKGATAYNALCATGLSVDSHQEPGGTWVDSIGKLAHTEGTKDGWMYHVNGSTPMVLCSAYKLKDGDSVYWEFVQ